MEISRAVHSHICYLVKQINKKSLKSTVHELFELSDKFGSEARIFLVACLIEELDHREGKANQHIQKVAIIRNELASFAACHQFASLICQVFETLSLSDTVLLSNTSSSHSGKSRATASKASSVGFRVTEEFLVYLLQSVLRLPVGGQITVAVALLHSANPLIAAEASTYLRKRLFEYSPGGTHVQSPTEFAAPVHDSDALVDVPTLHVIPKLVLGALFHHVRTCETYNSDSALQSAITRHLYLCHPEAPALTLTRDVTPNSARILEALIPTLHPNCDTSPGVGDSVDTVVASVASPTATAASHSTAPHEAAAAFVRACQSSSLDEVALLSLSHTLASRLLAGEEQPDKSAEMDCGYSCTASSQAFREALAKVRRSPNRSYGYPLSELEVARLLVAMGNSLNLFDGSPVNPSTVIGPVFDALASAAGAPVVYAPRHIVNPGDASTSWRHEVVAAVLHEDYPHLDWPRVVASLDFPECNLASPHTFQFIVAVCVSRPGGVFPTYELLRKPFANAKAHIDALRHAIAAPPDAVSFTYGMSDASRILTPLPGSSVGKASHAFCCVDLYCVIFKLAAGGGPDVEHVAYHILEQAQSVVPDLVLLAVARSKVDDGIDGEPSNNDPSPLRSRVFQLLLTSFFAPLLTPAARVAPSAQQANLLSRLWDTSRALAATSLLAIVRGFASNATNELDHLRTTLEGVARVVALTMHLPDFATVLLSTPAPQSSLEVAVYLSIAGGEVEMRVASEPVPAAWQALPEGAGGGAGGGGGFKLEAWLSACLGNSNPGVADRFAAVCVGFLKRVVAAQSALLQTCRARAGAPLDGSGAMSGGGGEGEVRPPPPAVSAAEAAAQEAASKDAILKAEVLIVIFKALKHHISVLNHSTANAVQSVYEAACKVFPGLLSVSNHEIEELANTYFQRIYTSQQSMSEVIDMLKNFKGSADAREREIFKCMIHNLFDEYRFFERYPDKELRITGVLFGLLIQHQLVSSHTLGIALRYVLEALRKTPTNLPNSKMYRFGVFALEQFKSRLPKWPQYCAHIVAIPHLREQYPEFVAEIEASLTGGNPTIPLGSSLSLVAGAAMAGLNPGGVEGMLGEGGGGASSSTATLLPPVLPGAATSHAPTPAVAVLSTPTGPPPPRALMHSQLRSRLAAIGDDLKVALAAASSGLQIPSILPSAAAAAAAAKEAEERAAAASGIPTDSTTGVSGGGGVSVTIAPGAEGLVAAAGGMPTNRAIEQPAAAIQDRVNFIFNNVTEVTIEAKADETLSVLRPELSSWFASVVVKRISAMPNQQPIVRVYLEKMGNKALNGEVLRATLDAIRRLIISDRIRSEARERSTLKNLGSWLGKITLSRNLPLLYVDMNLKTMLYEAYESGRLIAVLPFVSKVLEGGVESRVYRPPNPWTMALLAVLVELHEVADLKINLKFEVEVLLKNFSLELKDVRPAHSLYRRRRPVLTNNAQFNANGGGTPVGVPGVPPGGHWGGVGGGGGGGSASGTAPPGGTPAIPGLLNLITLRAFSSIFYPSATPPPPAPTSAAQATPPDATGGGGEGSGSGDAGMDEGAERDESGGAKANLRNVVAVAVDRAVRELIQPVVDRSITIAVITTRELVTKDFASEPDAGKMAHAAHALVADMAGSLSLVTCQDPLRMTIGNHLRNLLSAHPSVITSLPVSISTLGDAAVNAMLQAVVNENLELACLLIEKAAMDRAVKSIDDVLAPAYTARRNAADAALPFVDTAAGAPPNSRWPGALPDALRQRPGVGLSSAQMRLYDAFAHVRTGSLAPRSSHSATDALTSLATTSTGAGAGAGSICGIGGVGVGAGVGSVLPSIPGGVSVHGMGMGMGMGALQPGASAFAAAPSLPGGVEVSGSPLSPGQALQEYNVLLERLTNAIKATAASVMASNPGASGAMVTPATLTTLPSDHELVLTLKELRGVGNRIAPGQAREDVCIMQAQKLFRGLFELAQPPASVVDALAMHAYLTGLTFLRDVCRQLRKDIVTYLTFIPEDRRYAADVILTGLIRCQLISIPDFDLFLAKAMDGGRNPPALRLAMLVVYRSTVAEKYFSATELPATIDVLLQVGSRPSAPPSLHPLLDAIRASAASGQPGGATPASAAAAAEKARIAAVALGVSPPGAPGSPPPSMSLAGLATPLPVTPSLAAPAASVEAPYTDAVRSQVLYLLEVWVRICADAATGAASEKQFHTYLANLGQQGVLANDASTERFFRVMMDLCVQSCAATAKPHPSGSVEVVAPGPLPRTRLTYTGVDALSKLVYVLVKVAEGTSAKIGLFNKLVTIFARSLMRDADANGAGSTPEAGATGLPTPEAALRFDQRPYLRLLTNLLRDMYQQPPHANAPPSAVVEDTGADTIRVAAAEASAFNAQILASFANILHALRPERVPGFTFAWLEMMCHRQFLPALLQVPGQRGWPLIHRLLIDLFRFLYPALRRAEMNEGVKMVYKSTLRLLLVLHHDFPEFLADYHASILDVLPPSCIQLRNLLLTANPKSSKLPDPFQAFSYVELLPECTVLPRILGAPSDTLPLPLRELTDAFILGRAPLPPAASLGAIFAGGEEQAFSLSRYSLTTINALILHLAGGTLARCQEEAIAANPAHVRGTVPSAAIVAAGTASPALELIRFLLAETDAEGRYAVLNAMANQLRYPNAHTLLFSRMLLSIFMAPTATGSSSLGDVVREQLTRVMIERVIVHRPHPWGLLVTFIDLIKNPAYRFWSHPFTRMNTDIEKLFESVARSCMAPTASGASGAGFVAE